MGAQPVMGQAGAETGVLPWLTVRAEQQVCWQVVSREGNGESARGLLEQLKASGCLGPRPDARQRDLGRGSRSPALDVLVGSASQTPSGRAEDVWAGRMGSQVIRAHVVLRAVGSGEVTRSGTKAEEGPADRALGTAAFTTVRGRRASVAGREVPEDDFLKARRGRRPRASRTPPGSWDTLGVCSPTVLEFAVEMQSRGVRRAAPLLKALGGLPHASGHLERHRVLDTLRPPLRAQESRLLWTSRQELFSLLIPAPEHPSPPWAAVGTQGRPGQCAHMSSLSPATAVIGGGESLWEGAQAPACPRPPRAAGLDHALDALTHVGSWGRRGGGQRWVLQGNLGVQGPEQSREQHPRSNPSFSLVRPHDPGRAM